MRTEIKGQRFDQERALYNAQHTDIHDCVFAGPADGESVLKEARDIRLTDCSFSLRYPLWHVQGFTMQNSTMDELTRAAIWYARDGRIDECTLTGVKAVRECENIALNRCTVVSQEFGWKSRGVSLRDTDVTAEYIFLDSRDVTLKNVRMKGKYSFQYVENLTIEDSVLDTKDAFCHSKNVTVKNSVVKGEYLAWFSDGLTLDHCKIIGTQPLCYCTNLKLIDCEMARRLPHPDTDDTRHRPGFHAGSIPAQPVILIFLNLWDCNHETKRLYQDIGAACSGGRVG